MATVCNTLGYGLPLTALTLVLAVLLLRQQQRLLALGMLMTFGVRWSDVAVKAIVAEPRPSPTLIRAQEHLTDGSFPSGHVVGTAVVLGLLLIALPFLRMPGGLRIVAAALSLLLIAGVGLSRVWVGVHWPSDVLGGYTYAALFLLPAVSLSVCKSP
ncbi:MAG TPA: phosphatase PAP2 family protein [Dehalococcoidia bacterium]|nr:phosphatase PAP2 family protein [Dehalococcoidia bacterium]